MKVVLTKEQIDALIELVRAINARDQPEADLYDAVREHRAIDEVRAVFSEQAES